MLPKTKTFLLAAALTTGLLSACSIDSVTNKVTPYRIDIRQGNYIDQSMVAQLKHGMTPDQVRFVLGSPLIVDPFHVGRWDYVYRFQSGKGDVQQRIISVFFEDGLLAYLDGDVTAAEGEQQPAAEESAGKTRVVDIPAAAKK